MIETLAKVAAGGALGASARYLVNVTATRYFGPDFPWGTVIVNVVGSALMGVLVVVLAKLGGLRYAPFIMTGFLGGFTTFSAFSLDAVVLYERGEVWQAALYVMGSVVVSILALFTGMILTRWSFA
ncbi:MAG: fluoride efflux transporter CrcB [Pseudomonadota bacterium]